MTVYDLLPDHRLITIKLPYMPKAKLWYMTLQIWVPIDMSESAITKLARVIRKRWWEIPNNNTSSMTPQKAIQLCEGTKAAWQDGLSGGMMY